MEVVWELGPAACIRSKRASKACENCQRRKKKCVHQAPSSTVTTRQSTTRREPPMQRYRLPISRRTESATRIGHPTRTPLPESFTRRQSPEPIRVGEFHPESVLTDLSYSPTDTQEACSAEERRARRWHYDSFRVTAEKLPASLQSYLEEAGALRVLPEATLDALVTTYISSIDGLVPIVDGSRLLRDYGTGQASPFLVKAVCLIACKMDQAAPHLRLASGGPLLKALQFATDLYKGLDIAMKMDLEPDRVARTQILALMSLHNDGRGGVREASSHLSQAIHEAWVLSLHFEVPRRTNDAQCRMLWWTLRTLDRFNAFLQGCPFMIADRDIQIRRPQPVDYRSQVTVVALQLGDILGEVMDVYRPTQTSGLLTVEKIPSFREAAGDTDVDLFQESHRHYLELWYLAMATLSCRDNRPESVGYKRRVRCCDRIQELTENGRHAALPPLPLVPYTVSMALAVAYRTLKDDQKERPMALHDLRQRYRTLEALGACWWTAGEMARLSKPILQTAGVFDSLFDTNSSALSDSHQHLRSPRILEPPLTRQMGMDVARPLVSLSSLSPMTETTSVDDHTLRLSGTITNSTDLDSVDLSQVFGDVYNIGPPDMNEIASFWSWGQEQFPDEL